MIRKLSSLLENKKALTILLVFFLAGFCVYVFGIEGFNGLYGQDSHAYLKYAKELQAFMLRGESTKEFYWPILYPLIGALIGLCGLPLIVVMQGISFASFVLILFVLNKIIRLLYAKDGTLFIILAAATQVYFLRGGFLSMSDMLGALFVLLVVYKFLNWNKQKRFIHLFFIILFAVCAFLTRYPSVTIIAPIILYVAWYYFSKWSALYKVVFSVVAISLIVVVAIFNNQFYSVGLNVFKIWKFRNWVSFSLSGRDGEHILTIPNIMYIFGNLFHIGYLSFGVLLIPFYKKLKINRVLLACILLYAFLLIGLNTQNYRFLLLVHPVVLIVIFPAFIALWEWLKKKGLSVLFVVGTLTFNIAFFAFSFSKTLKVFSTEREVVQEIIKLKTNEPIYSFYVDQSFPTYGVTNEVRNFYMEDYMQFESGALVVFNEAQLKDQWKNHRVMKNWNRLKANYQLDTLAAFNSNWKVYRIK